MRSGPVSGMPALAALVGLAALGCDPGLDVARGRAAVVDGAPTTGDPAVVALVPRRTRCQDQAPTVLCTGTLIAPRVVLLAAHCFDTFGPHAGYEVYVGHDLDSDLASDVASGAGQLVAVAEVARHPGFDSDTHTLDLALVRLVDAAPAQPLALLGASLDGSHVGTTVRVVGFGRSAGLADGQGTEGVKRTGTMVITEVQGDRFTTAPMPSMSCIGDSGGPVLIQDTDGTERLAGVTVSGDPACQEYAVNLRPGEVIDDFIAPFVAMTEATAPGYGSGLIGYDAVCSEPCMDDSDCPPGLVCQRGLGDAGTCTLPGLVPGAFGDACTRDSECSDDATCARLLSGGEDACRCHAPCAPIDLPPDPDGGGCRAAPGRASWSSLPVVCFLLCFLLRRGRRRVRPGPDR